MGDPKTEALGPKHLGIEVVQTESLRVPRRPSSSSRFSLVNWKFGVLGWTLTVVAVLVVNIVLAVTVQQQDGYTDGIGTLLDGDCASVARYDTGAHVLINILSTLLLSGSNYCMQSLTAPSRREVDQAHQAGKTLEIGIASFRNLFHVRRWKVVMWVLFAISSVPLHLFYNSVVFANLASNSYAIFQTNEAFVTVRDANVSAIVDALHPNTDIGGRPWIAPLLTSLRDDALFGQLDRLENKDCIAQYGQTFLSERRNLILVVGTGESNASKPNVFDFTFNDETALQTGEGCVVDPTVWMCETSDCDVPCSDRLTSASANPATWRALGENVRYCLSQPVEDRCQLRFSLPIAVTVIALNMAKFLLMLVLVLGLREERLHTIGDAVRSFLSTPEPATAQACLKTGKQFKKNGLVSSLIPMRWKRRSTKFLSAGGKHRRVFAFIFYVLAILVCIGLLARGLSETSGSGANAPSIFSIPIGAVRSQTMIRWNKTSTASIGFVANTVIANLPQLILSCAYFTYNGLFTSMLAEYEWSLMAGQRKGLRVSDHPRGAQRSTYFLQLPYRYAVPLLVVSGVMHWLVSQGLFLVAYTRFDVDGNPIVDNAKFPPGATPCHGSGDYCALLQTDYTCGWSPIALLAVILGGIAMITALLTVGCGFHVKPGMPLGGTCSGTIAAACHVDPAEAKYGPMELQKIKWGVVPGHATVLATQIYTDEPEYSAPSHYGPARAPSHPIGDHQIPRRPVTQQPRFRTGENASVVVEARHCAFSAREPEFPVEGGVYL